MKKQATLINSNLFIVKDNELCVSADVLTIPVFNSIWNADTSKGKSVAIKIIAIAYWATCNKSDYVGLPLIDRVAKLFVDYSLSPTNNNVASVNSLVIHIEGTKSVKQKLLASSYTAAMKIVQYLEDVEIDADKDDAATTIKTVSSVLTDICDIIDTIDNAELRVLNEDAAETAKNKLLGGGDITSREK